MSKNFAYSYTLIFCFAGVRKMALVVKNEEDFITAVKSIHNDRIVPIFLISNVTGQNLDLIRKVR